MRLGSFEAKQCVVTVQALSATCKYIVSTIENYANALFHLTVTTYHAGQVWLIGSL